MTTPSQINYETVVNLFHSHASRARTDEERSLLHRMATDLANRIHQEDRNFNQSDFLTRANINPDWGKLSAAA